MQTRKKLEDFVEARERLAAMRPQGYAEQEIFNHREFGKRAPSLRAMNDAFTDSSVWLKVVQYPALEFYRSSAQMEQAGYTSQQRRLSRRVRADYGNESIGRDVEAHVFESQSPAVMHGESADLKHAPLPFVRPYRLRVRARPATPQRVSRPRSSPRSVTPQRVGPASSGREACVR